MLPIKKLYVDSRFKSSDSESDSSFKVDLPTTLLMPQNTVFYIDDVSIPVSWYTVGAGRNNKLYYRIDGVARMAELDEGKYDLITLSNRILDALKEFYVGIFTVEPDINTNRFKIKSSTTSPFEILTDAQALAAGFSQPLQSINNVLRNTVPSVHDMDNEFVSNYLDFLPIRNLYIVSPNLGNYNTMSVSGERGIIKKVPVTANYNEMIFDQVVLGNDYLDCSRQTLSRLEFQLKDVFGNVVELNGNHWSFSIVFSHLPVED
jgi:hypothetical protein